MLQPLDLPTGAVRALTRRIALELRDPVLRGGYETRPAGVAGPAGLAPAPSVTALLHPVQDRIARAAVREEESGWMPVTIRPLPETSDAASMLLTIGHGGESPGFHAALHLPADIFAALKADAEAGRAGAIALTATTSLWLAASERHQPADVPVTWLIGRDEKGESLPARGLVERIEWGPLPAEAAGSAASSAPVPAAHEAGDELDDSVQDMLSRVNWTLRQLTLVLVFLLIVIALKR